MQPKPRSRNPTLIIISGVALALVVLLGVGIWYQFLRDDAPPRVSLADVVISIEATATSGTTSTTATTATESAATTESVAEVATDTSTDSTVTTATTDPTEAATEVVEDDASSASAGLDGTWVVTSGSESFVGYRIGEELATIGTTEAVGRTAAIESSATIDSGVLVSATVTADLTSLESDEDRRDRALGNQALETNTYPTATFELTEPVVLPESLADGTAARVTATGNLTLHGVTQAVQIPLDIQLSNGVLAVVGSLDITLADYGIEQPSAPIVASVDEQGTLELQLLLGTDG